MMELKLKLLGLARAADNNEHMLIPDTFILLRDALNASCANDALLGRIAGEKRRIAPMCFDCASPCGRTADPDASIFEDGELLAIDLELLERLLRCGLAFYGEAELSRHLNKVTQLYQ